MNFNIFFYIHDKGCLIYSHMEKIFLNDNAHCSEYRCGTSSPVRSTKLRSNSLLSRKWSREKILLLLTPSLSCSCENFKHVHAYIIYVSYRSRGRGTILIFSINLILFTQRNRHLLRIDSVARADLQPHNSKFKLLSCNMKAFL